MPIDCKGVKYEDTPLNKAEDITGHRFERLVALKRVKPEGKNSRMTYWLCKCDCGNEMVVNKVNLFRQHTKSCGCLSKEISNSQLKYHIGDKVNGFLFLGRDLTRKQPGGSYYWIVECPFCKKHYSTASSSIIRGVVKSCGCLNMSKGEYAIQELLKENKISFKEQVVFPDLYSAKGGYLKFDFGIYDSEENLDCLVEYDGIQHSIPKERFGGGNEYETIKQNDSLKNQYCKEKGIPLIRIPYTQKYITLEMLDSQNSQFLI